MEEFQAYLTAVFAYKARYGAAMRAGQAYYNVLSDMRPTLASQITATGRDPFYDDSKIPEFLVLVCEHMSVA